MEPVRPSPELGKLFDDARADVGDSRQTLRIAAAIGPVLDGRAAWGWWKSKLLRIGTPVGIGVAALVFVWASRKPAPHEPSPTAPRLAPPPVVTIAEPVASTEPTSTAPIATATEKPVVVAPKASQDPIVAEHDLLARARRALDTDPARTLSLASEHGRRFPDGMLSSEREFLRISALVKLGRTAEARAARDAFVRAWPDSAYRSEIDHLVSEK
jgi:hypothetical protein